MQIITTTTKKRYKKAKREARKLDRPAAITYEVTTINGYKTFEITFNRPGWERMKAAGITAKTTLNPRQIEDKARML